MLLNIRICFKCVSWTRFAFLFEHKNGAKTKLLVSIIQLIEFIFLNFCCYVLLSKRRPSQNKKIIVVKSLFYIAVNSTFDKEKHTVYWGVFF